MRPWPDTRVEPLRSGIPKEIKETRRQEARQQELWAYYLELPEEERLDILTAARRTLRFLPADKLETIEIDSPLLVKIEIANLVASRRGACETA